jgi:hypothetical protein
MTREFHRVLLADLPAWEAKGWRPAVELGGAVGADPWCAGTLATVTVTRDVPTEEQQTDPGWTPPWNRAGGPP